MSAMTPNSCGNCGAPLPVGAGVCGYCRAQFANAAPPAASTAGAAGVATASLDAEIAGRLRAGDKIGAVKLYQKGYGVGLVEAKRAIDELMRAKG